MAIDISNLVHKTRDVLAVNLFGICHVSVCPEALTQKIASHSTPCVLDN